MLLSKVSFLPTWYKGSEANPFSPLTKSFALGSSEMPWKTQRGRKNVYDDIKILLKIRGSSSHG